MLDCEDPIFCCTKNGQAIRFRPLFGDVAEWLATHARRHPRKPAVIFRHIDNETRETIDYRRLHDLVWRTAAVLARRAGVVPGDAVAYALPNRPEALILNLAAMWLGARAVPLDLSRDPLDRKRFKLQDASCKVLVVPGHGVEDARSHDRVSELDALCADQLTISLGPHDRTELDLLACWAESARPPRIRAARDVDVPCCVLYTSGTVGQPKGALLTSRSVLANALGIIDWLALDETDRLNLVLPLHHINSTVFALSTLLVGGTIILNSRYSVSRFWDVLAQEHATACSIVPTIMLDLLARQRDFLDRSRDLNRLDRIMIGSAPVPARAAMRFVETFGVKLLQGYGSTETSLRVTGVPVDLPARLYDQMLADNAVGSELSHCNVKIAGGAEEGCEGEILVRGPVVARGYLGDADATADAFRDGWFHTGDLGLWREIDGRRFFFVRGRLKEIIIKGGVNISPVAIENALLSTFPEVKACYVVGVADSRMQEDIAAAVVLHDAVEREHAGCVADRILARAAAGTIGGLSAYESPRYIVPMRPEELPTTSTGKVQRTRLKSLLARRTGCAASATPGSAK